MKQADVQPLREILHAAGKRYLTVRPHGFELHRDTPLRAALQARILSLGAARTLYQQRQPQCRSLNGLTPLDEPNRRCVDCRLRAQCTAQLRLDLFVDAQPFRLLLAYTSAKNALLYETQLRQRGLAIEDPLHRLTVIHRGSWGEVRFRLADNAET